MSQSSPQRTISNNLFFAEVEECIADQRSVEMLLNGFSMRPFLRHKRDVVVLAPIEPAKLRKGMVVLFRYRGAHLLHRYRGNRNGRLKMVGDGNYRTVEWAKEEDVVAYVESIKRGARNIGYGSLAWHLGSLWSLTLKVLRTVAIWIKRKTIG